MKRKALLIVPCLLLLLPPCVRCAEPAPATASVRMPVAPVTSPSPPSPTPISRLTGDQLFVIDSDMPVIVLASPPGLVTVTTDTGPLKIRGKFVDGSGKTETRTYKGKSVTTVEAIGKGDVELLVIPEGVKTEGEILRRRLAVDAGTPDPPPGPGPGPNPPQPIDPAPIPVAGFRVLIVFEEKDASKLPLGQHSAIYGKQIRDYLNAKCVIGADGKTKDWWILDQNVNTVNMQKHWQDAMARKRTTLPWLIVSDGKTGYEGPLPLTLEETMKILKKVGGE